MYKIRFTPLSKEDLVKTKKYLKEEFDETTANSVIKKLIDSIRRFEEFPLLGRPLANLIDIPTDYMYFVAEKNYVFYRLEDQSVKIIRILDTRRDYMRILFGA